MSQPQVAQPGRRDFLRRAGLAPIFLPGIWAARPGWFWLRPPAVPGQKTQACGCSQLAPPLPAAMHYDGDCFTVAGRDQLLYSGSFHYTRCPRPLWRDRLLKFKQAGLNTVETYIPWNYHELAPGRADMRPLTDLIELVHELGLWLVCRPGPYICAEWAAGGFPDWIVAEGFPLRAPNPRSIATSRHWYQLVMPVLAKYQITHGGPVILVQIENEYDYWSLPAAEKIAYLSALAGMAWQAGIEVPLFTNVCRQVHDRSNPVMARLFDTSDDYPRWNIQAITPHLRELHRDIPNAPIGIAELQGGWFARFGGKLSVDQPGVGPEQLDSLTKLALADGAVFLNYYMGHGGTNFDWAAETITTTYDYAAPVREGGGLWGKYYAMRGLGQFLSQAGPVLARAHAQPGAARASSTSVKAVLRHNHAAGFLFIQELQDQPAQTHITFSASSPVTRLPLQGELALAPREARILPLNFNASGLDVLASTAEILRHGPPAGRRLGYVVFYDQPGRRAELVVRVRPGFKLSGAVEHEFDIKNKTLRLWLTIDEKPQLVRLNNHRLLFLSRELALHTWSAPASLAPATLWLGAGFLESGQDSAGHSRAVLQTPPGNCQLAISLPGRPQRCVLDGKPSAFQYDPVQRLAWVSLHNPLPSAPVPVHGWTKFYEPLTEAVQSLPQLVPLQRLGRLPYGYIRYQCEFSGRTAVKLMLGFFAAGSRKRIFLNGHSLYVSGKREKSCTVTIPPALLQAQNQLVVVFEQFGTVNFGPHIADLKGLRQAQWLDSKGRTRPLNAWGVQLFPAAVEPEGRHRDLRSSFDWTRWPARPSTDHTHFLWLRAQVTLPSQSTSVFQPWNIFIESGSDALLYCNRHFIGRFDHRGPQSQFYVPEPWLQFGGENEVAVLLPYQAVHAPAPRLVFAPYGDFTAFRHRLEFQWS